MMDLPTRNGNKADHLLCVGSWLLDKKSRRFWIGGEEVRLSLLEFELLAFLMAYPNHAFSFNELLCAIWRYDQNKDGSKEQVIALVKRVRCKIGARSSSPRIIPIHGYGYQLQHDE